MDRGTYKEVGQHGGIRENLRQSVTIIPQEAFLFSGTLKINLDPFGKYSDEVLWDVLEKAQDRQWLLE
jgi:ABC-type multidrug transport system fused ATPase/permease subunit